MTPAIKPPVTIWRRDIGSTVANAGDALSSWDNCMSVSYCKYPVIAAIVVGSLIILSILFCCFRSLCCGLECCCGCFSCCNACCPSPRKKKGHKPVDSDPTPYTAQQYSSHPPPAFDRPQYATFEGKVHEDSLPVMPSWTEAASSRVEHVEPEKGDAMEMQQTRNGSRSQAVPNPGAPTRSSPDVSPIEPNSSQTPPQNNYFFPGERPSPPPGQMQRSQTPGQMYPMPPPQRNASQDSYGIPQQRPTPPPGPGQMRGTPPLQPQRSASQDTYGFPVSRPPPGPYMGGGPYQQSQDSGIYRQGTPGGFNQPRPGPPPARHGSPYQQGQSRPTGPGRYYSPQPQGNPPPPQPPTGASGPYNGGYQRPSPPQQYVPYNPYAPRNPTPNSWRDV